MQRADASERTPPRDPAQSGPAGSASEIPLEQIVEALRSIQYGTVQIVVQDGVIVQIDKTEKIRLRRNA